MWIEFRPNDDPTDIEFHFEDAVVGGVVPRNFIPAVEKGLRENINHGVLAGYPVVGLTAQAVRRLLPSRGLLGNGLQDRRAHRFQEAGGRQPRAA